MKSYRFLYIFLLFTLLTYSCKEAESPEFKYIDNLKISLLDTKTAKINADAVLYNPNKASITIKKLDFDIVMEEKVIAEFDRDMNVKVRGKSDFTLPLDVKINISELNINPVKVVLGMLDMKGKEVRYVGKVKVVAYGVPVTVKFDYVDTIKIEL